MVKGSKVQHNRPLTSSQKKVLEYIVEFERVKKYYPSLRDISYDLGFVVHAAAQYYVDLLEVKGYVLRFKGRIYKVTDKYCDSSK